MSNIYLPKLSFKIDCPCIGDHVFLFLDFLLEFFFICCYYVYDNGEWRCARACLFANVRRQICERIAPLAFPWILEIKLRFPGLCGKSLYLLSNITVLSDFLNIYFTANKQGVDGQTFTLLTSPCCI